ncbi:DUF72 domain-containing protein [Deferribacter autotrophicus]|uniref:DUF72 domain-containing protein n=1 Tax=Deferribacter autotrophicus TaxID=500465 RepID=A0A5A8F8P3_9BACT|nr:DUF72 domain-containing protein [Deferribacter autotrophicus]KAA0259051.1 DUF72 domain-containing protein [Deferribacter autotrophicus]
MITINETPVLVGTSGYKYDDWKGSFYPKSISNFHMLSYYGKKDYLNLLEITFTFYNIPYQNTVKSIVDRGENLSFSVRLNKRFLKGRYNKQDVRDFYAGLKPMIDKGKLEALFADFNFSFSASKENFEHILRLSEEFKEFPLFFELPNRTWYKDRFLELFREHRIGIIVLDMPKIKGLAPYYPFSSNNFTYYRLYGRSKLWLTPEDKYLDYKYSKEELTEFIDDIKTLSLISKKVFVSFCNVVNASACKNAEEFVQLIKENEEV